MWILSLSAESISHLFDSLTHEIYFTHKKMKFVISPSSHVIFCLFYRYWWKFYIKDNSFINSFSKQQNRAIKVLTYRKTFVTKCYEELGKSINVKIWQLIEKVTSNCTVFAPQSHFVNEISKELAVHLSGKLSCNWLIMLVTMMTHQYPYRWKIKIVFSCCAMKVWFFSKRKIPGISSVSIKLIENNTWACVDMEFLFECLTR